MLRRLKIPAIVLVTVLLNQAAGFAVHAAMPEAFLPEGTPRFVLDYATVHVSTTETSFVEVPDISKAFTIPSGKTGDVMVIFCGEARADSSMSVRAWFMNEGGANFQISPGYVVFRNGTSAETQCATFYYINATEGTKTVKIQWKATSGTADLYKRSLVVMVNVH